MTDDDVAWPSEDLTEVIGLERLSDEVFRLVVRDGWHQGRGAFGGLVLGALTRALEQSEPEPDRALRAFDASITDPVAVGEAEIRVSRMRRGNAVTTLQATLRQGDRVFAHATGIFGRKRQDDRRWTPEPPTGWPPWTSVAPVPLGPPGSRGPAPQYTQHFEYRPVGALPFSGAEHPVAQGYVRPRRATRLGPPEVVALADAWWPATLAIESAPRPVATVAFSLQYFPGEAPLPPDRPLFHRARTVAASEGYLVEMRELWTEGGALVALDQQTFVVIR